MANVDNGALSFKSELDNSQLDGAIEETLRRVQGLTDATVSGGQRMDEAFNLTAQTIREKIKEISVACDQHEAAIGELEAKYQELGYQAGQAFMQGRDEEYRKIEEQKNAIHGEIEVRKQLLQELHECSDALEEQAGKIEEHAQKVKENADVAQSMRSRIKELKEEMMNLIDQGIDKQSEAYQRLEDELGRLQDIQSDVAEQGRILAHDQAGFKGVLSGLSGLSGAFSAATGAISLFAGENEDLQKIMTRLQSVMAITIGLQQVSETLNKDSAFSLVTLRGLKEWWAKVVAAATTAETAETAATAANTAAKKIQAGATQAATAAETANAGAIAVEATAAKAGAVANFTLAGAFHAVGVAIKSIPVIGWVLAGVGALIALVSTLTGKTKEQEEAERKAAEAAEEAKRRHEEYQKTIRETGNSVQRNLVSKFLLLREQWSRLKSEAEKADFIKKRAQDFRDFGAAIDSVNKAEQFLNDNTGAIVESIMLRARAAVLMKQIEKSLEDGAFNIDSQGEDELPSGKYKIGYGVAKNLSKELADVEEQIDKIMSKFKKLGDDGSSSKKDPFVENLKKRKVEYERFKSWVNSGDQVLVEAAQTEFKALLKEGATYIDYLKNQRDKILEIGVDKRTKEQNENLRKLNDALAAETKRTVMDAFNEELSMQLTNARSVLEVLAIIEKRRKELENDTSGLGQEKANALDKAEREALARQKQETDELLEQYAGYLDRKIKLELKYNDDLRMLQQRRAQATTDTERASIDMAISNRTAQFNRDMQSSGDNDYDELRQQYQTYQEKVSKIRQDYEEKRRVATLHGDQEMLAKLAKAESDELSHLANEQLTSSIDWQRLFGNLDEMSTKTINELIAKINAKKIEFGGQFNPADLQAINEQLEKARQEVESRNPFKALGNAFERLKQQLRNNKLLDSNDPFVLELKDKEKEYQNYVKYIESGDKTLVKGADKAFADLLKNGSTYLEYLKRKKNELQGKIDMGIDTGNSMAILDAAIQKAESGKSSSDLMRESLKETFSSVSGTLDFVKGSFDAVTGSLEKFGVKMDEETQQILGDIGGMIEGASQLSQGIATGNPLSVIQGSIGLLSSAYDLFNSRDRKAQKSIKKHKEDIERLERAYKQLEWQINRALGGEVYSNQKAAIRNMEQQQAHLRGMIEDEKSKKHTDWGDIEKYQEQIAELDRNIQDMLDEISKDILQTTAKDMANELGDALVEAFGKGEDAADAFDKTVNEVLKNAVLNQLKKNFLEKQLQGALDQLEKSMGYWNGDDFIFDGLTDYEINQFKSRVQGIANTFNQAMGEYSEIFKDLDLGDKDDESLTGAVKGVSEETASLIGGQMNAIRLNQVEVAGILRQQLTALNAIQQNTSYNRILVKISQDIEKMSTSTDGDSARSMGI